MKERLRIQGLRKRWILNSVGPVILILVLASLLAGLHGLLYLIASRYWPVTDRLRQIPYAAYMGAAALSVACMPLNSAWYSWCSSWCSTRF